MAASGSALLLGGDDTLAISGQSPTVLPIDSIDFDSNITVVGNTFQFDDDGDQVLSVSMKAAAGSNQTVAYTLQLYDNTANSVVASYSSEAPGGAQGAAQQLLQLVFTADSTHTYSLRILVPSGGDPAMTLLGPTFQAVITTLGGGGGGTVGPGTVNYIPIFTAATVIGDSAFSCPAPGYIQGDDDTDVYFQTGDQVASPTAPSVTIRASDAKAASNVNGGDVTISPGAGDGSGIGGNFTVSHSSGATVVFSKDGYIQANVTGGTAANIGFGAITPGIGLTRGIGSRGANTLNLYASSSCFLALEGSSATITIAADANFGWTPDTGNLAVPTANDTGLGRSAAGRVNITNGSSTNYLTLGVDVAPNSLIKCPNATGTSNGNNLTIRGSDASTSGTGGSIILTPGSGAGGGGPGFINTLGAGLNLDGSVPNFGAIVYTGFASVASNAVDAYANTSPNWGWGNGKGPTCISTNQFMWSSGTGTNITSTADTGLGRAAAGRVNITNGSSTNYLTLGDDSGPFISFNATGASVPVSAAGMGRIRYNDTTKTFQVSADGGAYASLTTGGVSGSGTSPLLARWSGASTVTVVGAAPTTADATADAIIGASATTTKPLVLQTKASPTANAMEVQTSNGSKYFSIPAIAGTLTVTGNLIAGEGAGSLLTSGDENVIYGQFAGATLTTGRNNVLVGDSADVSGSGDLNTVAVGSGAYAGTQCVLVGSGTQSGDNSIIVGEGSECLDNAVIIGRTILSATNNDLVIRSGDTGISRVAANVIKPYDGTNDGWFQNAAGRARVTAQFDKTDTSLALITGLSWNLTASRSYSFMIVLIYGGAGISSGGIKVDLGGGSATATTINATATTSINGASPIAVNATALTGALANNNGATYISTVIYGTITVNAGGTFGPRFAQNSASSTSSVLVGSYGFVEDMP